MQSEAFGGVRLWAVLVAACGLPIGGAACVDEDDVPFDGATVDDPDGGGGEIPADSGSADDAAAPVDGSTPPAGAVVDRWISYGNGPASLFSNAGESTLGVANAAGLQLKWMKPWEVNSPASVVDGRVYVTTVSNGLYALDVADGAEIWHQPDVSSSSAPAYDTATDILYVNRWEGGVVHSIDIANGSIRWAMPASDQAMARGWSSPALAGERLVVGIATSDRGMVFKGGLAVFDLAAETRAFVYTHAEPAGAGASVWGGPSIDVATNAAFAGSGNNYTLADGRSDALFGVDLGSQEMLWNQQMTQNDRWAYDCFTCGPDHDFGTNPMLLEHEGRPLLAAGQKSGSFWLVDRMTGEVLWEKKLSATSHPAYGGVLNNGAFDGTRILVAANEGSRAGKLYALDPDPAAAGAVLWERPLAGLVLAPITVANGLGFVPVGMTLEVIDASTGTTLATLPADAPVAGGAAVSHGQVFFGSGISYYDMGAQPGAFHVYGL